MTPLRLARGTGAQRFRAACLTAWIYDLNITPSPREAARQRLVIDRRDLEMFARQLVLNGESPSSAEVSPLYADLRGLPPVLLSAGTADPLRDDSFLVARLLAAAGEADLKFYPGGCEMFWAFETSLAGDYRGSLNTFITSRLDP